MKLCLAGISAFPDLEPNIRECKYQLESFFFFEDWQKSYIHDLDLFLLDSGAFSFMNGVKDRTHKMDWDAYLTKYINFINENEIDYFFELDVDSVIGYDKVLNLTHRLEEETKKQCIPVFHKSRGLAEWERMCNEYDYVAIGTIYEYNTSVPVLKKLVNYANKCGTKVHGLGFTHREQLPHVHFYSVDSTSWIGSRFGHLYNWDTVNQKLVRYCSRESFDKKMRLKDYKDANIHNFYEWCKYQKWCDIYLR